MLERSLAIKEKHFGPDHPQTGTILINLGNAYGNFGDYEKKRQMLERALAISEKHFGPDHPQTGITVFNLAVVYSSPDSLPKAIELMTRAYQIFSQFPGYGESHPHTKLAFQSL